jgi:hypothetical protein
MEQTSKNSTKRPNREERGANRRQPLLLACIREPSAAASGGSRLAFAMKENDDGHD